MRTNLPRLAVRARQGSVLMMTMFIAAVVGLVLFATLSLVSSRTRANARSQAWNSCISVAEAGVEEALSHLNKNGVNITADLISVVNLEQQGWQLVSGQYYMRRAVGSDCYYEVQILPGARPVITSTGFVPLYGSVASAGGPFLAAAKVDPWSLNVQFMSRTVQAKCRAVGRFTKALVAKSKIELKGVNVFVDSYNSYDPAGSTYSLITPDQSGIYDPAKRRDTGDIAVLDGFDEILKIESSTVRGKVSTGPDGDIRTNKTALVGSLDWCATQTKGIQPGWSANDATFNMPDVKLPYPVNSKPEPLKNIWVTNAWGTNFYNWVLPNGEYQVKDFKGSVLVTGKATLLATDKIEFSEDPKDDHGITFEDGAQLQLYADCGTVKLVGKKDKKKKGTSVEMYLNGEGNPTNFILYGTTQCKNKIEIKNMDDFTGMVYAPQAEVHIKAGSLKYYHCNVHGTVMGKKIVLEKNATFHYDENIANLAADSYVVESWTEL